jgi:hypothetical protein
VADVHVRWPEKSVLWSKIFLFFSSLGTCDVANCLEHGVYEWGVEITIDLYLMPKVTKELCYVFMARRLL